MKSPFGLRPMSIETGINLYAEGSALIKMGNTHVICTATIEDKVPPWLIGKGRGWVTAEYSMLPRATNTRTERERSKVSGRTMEIQRLIGRSLRPMINLTELGERTISIDCDVIQADGGTRTASVNGACVALALAMISLIQEGKIPNTALKCLVSAISVGSKDQQICVDLDYALDSTVDVDMNFVFTSENEWVEVQGTAEGAPMPMNILPQLTTAALEACQAIQELQLESLQKSGFRFS